MTISLRRPIFKKLSTFLNAYPKASVT